MSARRSRKNSVVCKLCHRGAMWPILSIRVTPNAMRKRSRNIRIPKHQAERIHSRRVFMARVMPPFLEITVRLHPWCNGLFWNSASRRPEAETMSPTSWIRILRNEMRERSCYARRICHFENHRPSLICRSARKFGEEGGVQFLTRNSTNFSNRSSSQMGSKRS